MSVIPALQLCLHDGLQYLLLLQNKSLFAFAGNIVNSKNFEAFKRGDMMTDKIVRTGLKKYRDDKYIASKRA
ncbi:hypothetical protein [Legionella spiritensis]|uniref:hypothetical protein n=1 Tax=Legionella spiritensis TaxID=452 RepID=UPI000F6E4563|nr:hypothetical protein [Legionella spiritensis]VEG89788.1 Uncharacterised protein [Legionella spiritensis]